MDETKVHWEHLQTDASDLFMYRTRIPGGWLIYVGDTGAGGGGVTFFPDPKHEWNGPSGQTVSKSAQ